jgi:small redox-active disulfide protein 2
MNIKILGPGCARCRRLEANTRTAVDQLGIQAEVLKIDDLGDIVAHGVMSTPALAIGDTVVLSGRVATPQEIEALLAKALSRP